MNMTRNYRNSALALLAIGLPLLGLAQPVEEKKVQKESRQITITTTEGDTKGKLVIEVDGDKVTVNGKPVDDLKDGDVKVKVRKVKDVNALLMETRPGARGGMTWFEGAPAPPPVPGANENRAMLGVTTEKVEEGAQVKDVTPESAAEKAKLKEGDIIVKVDDEKISSPDELSAAIRKHKPGDKVTITYLRDKKQDKVTAELGKWKGVTGFNMGPGNNFRMDLGDLDFGDMLPRIQEMPFNQGPFNRGFGPAESAPKLGLTVQDTDDGKGVRVLEVEEESNAAKAEIRENDIITQVEDKVVNSVDELSRELKARKGQSVVKLQVIRGGKPKSIDVKMPRKLKTADL